MKTADHDFYVTIHGRRGDEWERVCGTREFPVRSPIPVLAELPGIPGQSRVYLLALDLINPTRFTKIVCHLCEKFGMTVMEATAEMQEKGIPILERGLQRDGAPSAEMVLSRCNRNLRMLAHYEIRSKDGQVFEPSSVGSVL